MSLVDKLKSVLNEDKKILKEYSEIDDVNMNRPITVASIDDSDYDYCSMQCIYLDDDNPNKVTCALFKADLVKKQKLPNRAQLCLDSDDA